MKDYTVFLRFKRIIQKKWIEFEFILSENYDDYFMKYLAPMKSINDDKYDLLAIVRDFLGQINEPSKPIRHIVISDDNFALEILKDKNWQYFIERLLEVYQTNNIDPDQLTTPQETKIIKDSIKKLTICETLYTNLYNQVAENLMEYLKDLPPNELEINEFRAKLFLY